MRTHEFKLRKFEDPYKQKSEQTLATPVLFHCVILEKMEKKVKFATRHEKLTP